MSDAPQSIASYRTDLEVYPDPESDTDRIIVYCPLADVAIALNKKMLVVAKLFDGQASHKEICARALKQNDMAISAASVIALEKKLLQLNILQYDDNSHKVELLKSAHPTFKFIVLKINPNKQLDKLYYWMPWIFTTASFCVSVIFTVTCLGLFLVNMATFGDDLYQLYNQSNLWLLVCAYYVITLLSIVCHELGHAMSCLYFGVKTNEITASMYLILPQGAARPNQLQWSKLSVKQKMLTVFMGGHFSMIYAGIGVILWQCNINISLNAIGLLMAFGSTTILLPTLLPWGKGDMRLALDELKKHHQLTRKAAK